MAPDGKASAALDSQIEAQVDEWSSNSTDAFEISLYKGEDAIETFQPEFTYPIFGEDEAIFGYQGLKISLSFSAHNMQPHIEVTYDRKWPDQGDVKASDVEAELQDFVPKKAFSHISRSSALVDPDASTFIPPGQKLHTYKHQGNTFEIWRSSLADPAALSIVQNMQILVPLYIEGGTIIELEQPWIVERWKLFLLYHVDGEAVAGSSYSLAGFATSFRVFTFKDRQGDLTNGSQCQTSNQDMDQLVKRWSTGSEGKTVVADEKSLGLTSRERISQFIVLPPYQGQGLGAQLYNTMYAELTSPANVCELTVEDPNEAFDDLRDVCDLVHLRAHNRDFANLKINSAITAPDLKSGQDVPVNTIIDGQTKERIRTTSKIMPRQISRLIEMQTLSKIPPLNRSVNRITRKEKASNEHDRAYYFWRLYVKQRLYIHNRDTLIQVDLEERIDKLEQAVEGVQGDYERLLGLAEKRATYASEEAVAAGSRSRKRRRAIDDDTTEPDEPVATGATSRKRRANRVLADEDEDGEDIGDALDD